jgi:hypothetical protein
VACVSLLKVNHRLWPKGIVGVPRFELGTFRSRSERPTRLGHTPKKTFTSHTGQARGVNRDGSGTSTGRLGDCRKMVGVTRIERARCSRPKRDGLPLAHTPVLQTPWWPVIPQQGPLHGTRKLLRVSGSHPSSAVLVKMLGQMSPGGVYSATHGRRVRELHPHYPVENRASWLFGGTRHLDLVTCASAALASPP